MTMQYHINQSSHTLLQTCPLFVFRGFTQNILPDSFTRPFLIYAYSDFCLDCVRVEHIWQQIAQDLETTGIKAK